MPTAALGAGGPVVSRIGLGLAALGRPAYITSGREEDLPDRSVAGMRTRTFLMLDAAYAAGVRYVDAARSYGRAEEFLSDWLAGRGYPDMIIGSKWGYRYTVAGGSTPRSRRSRNIRWPCSRLSWLRAGHCSAIASLYTRCTR